MTIKLLLKIRQIFCNVYIYSLLLTVKIIFHRYFKFIFTKINITIIIIIIVGNTIVIVITIFNCYYNNYPINV